MVWLIMTSGVKLTDSSDGRSRSKNSPDEDTAGLKVTKVSESQWLRLDALAIGIAPINAVTLL